MSIAFIDLKAQQARIRDKVEAGFQMVLDHGAYIMGPEISALETRLGEWTGVVHNISCSSGTDALLLALMGLKLVFYTSAKIGIAPMTGMTSALAAKVKEGTMTPWPGCSSSPISASNNASVPDEQEILCATPVHSPRRVSNVEISGPII